MANMAGLALLALLAGCGKVADLKPAAGAAMPPAPYGAKDSPGSEALLAPSQQARPGTGGYILTRSEPRKVDEFDLPPGYVAPPPAATPEQSPAAPAAPAAPQP